MGVDLSPVDVTDDDAVRWLAACVYADQPERLSRLRAAVAVARRRPVPVVAGAALDVLPEVVAGLPEDLTPCLFHTWVVTYFTRAERTRFVALVGQLAARRPLLWIAGEPAGTLPGLDERAGPGSGESGLALAEVTGGEIRWRRLGRMHSHGHWLEWTDPESAGRTAR